MALKPTLPACPPPSTSPHFFLPRLGSLGLMLSFDLAPWQPPHCGETQVMGAWESPEDDVLERPPATLASGRPHFPITELLCGFRGNFWIFSKGPQGPAFPWGCPGVTASSGGGFWQGQGLGMAKTPLESLAAQAGGAVRTDIGTSSVPLG